MLTYQSGQWRYLRARALWLCTVLALLSACATNPSAKRGGSEPVNESFAVKNSLARALAAMDAGDHEAAGDAFRQMLDKGAKSPDSLNHYAIYLREQWQLEDAEKVYLQALVAAPNNAMTHYNLGILYELYLGKQAMALKHYRRYQDIVEEPDKKVSAWIKALERENGAAPAGGGSVPTAANEEIAS